MIQEKSWDQRAHSESEVDTSASDKCGTPRQANVDFKYGTNVEDDNVYARPL